MNLKIDIQDLTVVGADKKQMSALTEAMVGNYVQWTDTYYHPIADINQLEVTNMINHTGSKYYEYNMRSLNLYFANLPEEKVEEKSCSSGCGCCNS